MRTYAGHRSDVGDVKVTVTYPHGTVLDLKHVAKHSPTGMEWGYLGSGPSDLAFSILMDVLDGDKVTAGIFYQRFKEDFVAKWLRDDFEISEDTIMAWLRIKWQILAKETGVEIPQKFR